MNKRILKKYYDLQKRKNIELEKALETIQRWLPTYYIANYQEKHSLPEWVKKDDVLYTFKDKKQGKMAILLK